MNDTIIEENLDSFLKEVGAITKKHKKISREKGEDFNLFSIMGMETNETYTHSAILASLLDPSHNHYKGTFFLEKFLEKIGYSLDGENLGKTIVTKEFHIGKIDDAYEKGGFIDILLIFDSGRTIAIENKINAHDQKHQLYRYSKYNEANTTLFYLNRYGTDPTKYSYHTLDIETIQKISYKEDIIEWLKECRESLKPDSILSISIKKYILLLKKLTKTMDKSRERELTTSILNNYEAAEYVHGNFDKLINTVRENFRQAVIKELNDKLDTQIYRVEPGNTPDYHHSQIWIELVKTKDSSLRFGVESFSGKGNKGGKMLVGIFDKQIREINIDFVDQINDSLCSKWWPVIRELKTLEQNTLHLNSGALLNKLADKNAPSFKGLLNNTISQILKFINEYTSVVVDIENKQVVELGFSVSDDSSEERD